MSPSPCYASATLRWERDDESTSLSGMNEVPGPPTMAKQDEDYDDEDDQDEPFPIPPSPYHVGVTWHLGNSLSPPNDKRWWGDHPVVDHDDASSLPIQTSTEAAREGASRHGG
jgi:hypothetical protein